MNNIIDYLDELYPNPNCELNYNSNYELLIAVMLSAQTTDKRVNEVTKVLFNKYKTLKELNDASIEELIKIIKPIGNQNKKAQYIKNITSYLINNPIANDRKKLENIKGIGRKSASLVLGILYNTPYMPVDTHVKRVSRRLNLVNTSNILEIENQLEKRFKNRCMIKIHMQLVLFGRYKCRAIKPLCEDCKLKNICKKSSI